MTPYRDVSRVLWPGLPDGIPAVFHPQVEEPAFSDGEEHLLATAVLLRLAENDRCPAEGTIVFPPSRGPIDIDGSGMLEILGDDIADRYAEFAADYYEIDVDRAAVEHIVAHRPLTDAVVRALNPSVTATTLRNDLAAIGYTVETS